MRSVPELLVFFGLIASGKSTVAQAWAKRHGMRYYNSDRLRKELAGLDAQCSQQESVDQGIYSQAASRRTYDALLSKAEADLAAGRSAVLDASYQYRAERDRIREMAGRLGVNLLFVLCVCPEDEMRRRMAARARNPRSVSDGRWEIYLSQRQRFESPDELSADQCFILDTDKPLSDLLANLEKLIED